MHTRLVLTVIGPDRPGLVDLLSAVLVKVGGSWQKSRMARLAGHFAGVVEVEVPTSEVYALRCAFEALGERGLIVQITPTAAPEAVVAAPRVARLAFVGQDRPGLVQAIAHVLAQCGVNVDELETHTFLAPMSGVTIFEADAAVHLPDGLALADLRGRLEEVAKDLVVDVELALESETLQ